MAAIDTLIQIQQGNKVGLRESKELELWFKSLGIGTDNIQVRQSASGELEIVAKLKVADGTDATHVVTKQQLTAATGSVLADVSALTTRVSTAESDIDALEVRETNAEAAIVALDDRLDTAEATIVTHTANIATNVTSIATNTANIATNATNIATNTANIAGHETRITGAETNIGQLQADLGTIQANTPDEQEFTTGGVVATFTLTQFAVNASNLVRDIEVFVDGRRQMQATSGTFSGNKTWRKNSTSQIELSVVPPAGRVVTVWKQGTAVVVSGGGGTDLQNITVNPQPLTNGSKSLGTSTKGWDGVNVKDVTNAQVWKIQVNGGVLEAIAVP